MEALASERRVWSAEEDEKILALVAQHGTRAWSVIASHLQFLARPFRNCSLVLTARVRTLYCPPLTVTVRIKAAPAP